MLVEPYVGMGVHFRVGYGVVESHVVAGPYLGGLIPIGNGTLFMGGTLFRYGIHLRERI